MVTALIVDDEPLARAHLRYLLSIHEIEILGEASNAIEALQLAEDTHPDLVFLDIQMPGLTGMQAASAFLALDAAPQLIFVTGYSEHAADAYNHDALDYLVKPVAPDRLARTVVRARERLTDASWRRKVREAVHDQAAAKDSSKEPLKRLPVRKNYEVHLLRVEDILYAMAREKRVFVQTVEGEYRTYYTLTLLETLLPGNQFVRIQDAYLVNLDRVQTLLFMGGDSHLVRLSNGEELPVGRKYYKDLHIRLGINNVSS